MRGYKAQKNADWSSSCGNYTWPEVVKTDDIDDKFCTAGELQNQETG